MDLANLCSEAGSAIDFTDLCIRDAWSALIPATIVCVLCAWKALVLTGYIFPEKVKRLAAIVGHPFQPFLGLKEAEDFEGRGENSDGEACEENGANHQKLLTSRHPLWRALVFVFVGLIQSLTWLAIGSYHLYTTSSNGLFPLCISLAWLYTTIRPVAKPSATPMFDSLSLYTVLLIGNIVKVAGVVYDSAIGATGSEWGPLQWVAASTNLFALLLVFGVLLSMPLNIPGETVKKEDIGKTVSQEDYTSLFGWITFSWIYPLVKLGRYNTLQENDVWNLSVTMRSKAVFGKFSEIQRSSLLRRLWAANSLDLILDVTLTFASVLFQYSTPLFLKLILDAIGQHNNPVASSTFLTVPRHASAYIYALLAFIFTLCKSEADVQHLWYGRRASTRIRSELMAAIYDKALKRKDLAGVVQQGDKEQKNDSKATGEDPQKQSDKNSKSKKKSKVDKKREAKEEKERAAKADDPKAGADVGKIVNLMAGDANRISQTVSSAYFIYGAPLEIGIASFFLYQLLGWSAFAGFFVLFLGWPLNSYISRRSIRIQKGLLTARDKRMGVLTELIGAVKFIKFFAWEERWIGRALDAREVELKWMVKARINSVMFYLLWTLAPILVSIISFFTFVAQGNELTISVAFTSIALFNMIRTPLNVIPSWIVQILQTGVALKRVAVYLNEEEVDHQVSSLKKDLSQPRLPGDGDEGLGLENASLKWNEVEEAKDDKKDGDTRNGRAQENSSSASSIRTDDEEGRSGDTTPIVEDIEVVEGDDATSLSLEGDIIGEQRRFELKDIGVKFPEGQLTLVTGPTASGKTALLMAVLGEMTLLSGRIVLNKDISRIDEHGFMHSISYAAQTPWLRHQSIKENILFGYPDDEERYKKVVEACALKPDLEMLEDGDATEIGARGVSLSGGQKARVALARAVYARTKYVLLDDPLSAVDSHTSRFLYEKLLCGPLLANRTVVLVTHHVELVLPGAYYLVRMLDGRIDTQGRIQDLQTQGLLDDITHDAAVDAHQEELDRAESKEIEDNLAVESENAAKKPRKLIKDEHRETGGVKWSIYKSYLKASSYWIWGFLAFLVVVAQLLGVSEKLWIKTWGEAYPETDNVLSLVIPKSVVNIADHEAPTGDGYHNHYQQFLFQAVASSSTKSLVEITWPNAVTHPYFYVGVYAAIGVAIALASILSVTAQYTAALRASRVLFKKFLITVVRATFRFHDTTPQGRMLNRFGKDIETIDSSLASSLQAVNSSLASFFAAVITIGFVFPYFLIPAFFIGFAYRELAIGYLNTGRDLRRMESNTRSPIFSDFGELLEGIVTVRAFSAERRFLNNLHKKIDTTTKMWYSFWMTNRWLLLNFDALGGLAVLVTTMFSIATLTDGAGLAGLCITSAMSFTSSVYWACRFWTALELDLNSVERVVEYLDLPQEPPGVIEDNRAPAYWPSSQNNDSLLVVENLVIKYAPDLPPVLHDVSFTLKAGERVGLLGRTGSGKSTLAMSILRFVDPTNGRIIIDGIDISTIGIHDLRSRLTFIPQDATLFSGTLRDNLDPFDEHDDAECLDVLRRVHLITDSTPTSVGTSREQSAASSRTPSIINVEREATINSVSTSATEVDSKAKINLDTKVSAGGTNFSQGQRQLIAMARALLRKSSIIVLDEATSSIDFATDAKIQTTIREEFTGSLLLTVAHRLRTVIDYDRLIVLDRGEVVEFDTPWNLIRKDNGIFRSMCLKSGSFGELEATAKATAESREQL